MLLVPLKHQLIFNVCRFILLTITIAIGLVGNTLSILTLRRPSFSDSSTIPFLIALAFYDNIEVIMGELISVFIRNIFQEE